VNLNSESVMMMPLQLFFFLFHQTSPCMQGRLRRQQAAAHQPTPQHAAQRSMPSCQTFSAFTLQLQQQAAQSTSARVIMLG